MPDQVNAFLLIADISGYTSFMKQHAVSVSHAKQIIVRLLKALIQAAKPPLKVAELEGDAVFFYARSNGKTIEHVADELKGQIAALFAAFTKELRTIDSLKTCSCYACDHAHDLQLKQVLHAGIVEMEKIEQFEKLFGLDVILVHRMLKNSVPANEYVMMTNPTFALMKDFHGLQPERFTETFEGVGEVETLVFYPHQLPKPVVPTPAEIPPPSWFDKLRWRWEISVKALGDLLGFSKYSGTFKNASA
jgi:hypothetical protein